jgi:hypothetical protein
MTIYAVVFGMSMPPEIHSLWWTVAEAQKEVLRMRACDPSEREEDWRVEQVMIRGEKPDEVK